MGKQADATTVWRADITDFKRAMQEARRYVKLAESEFQEATGKSKKWATATDSLKAKIDSLNKKVTGHERELEALNIEYEKAVMNLGENSRYAQELQIKINNQKAAIKDCTNQIDKYTEELRKANAYGNDFDDTMGKMNSGVEKLSGGFSMLKMVLSNLIADGIRLAVREMKDLAQAAYEAGANFETSMSEVKAIAQATPADMERITEKAKEMGRTTKFTATEAGNAMYYMAQAGWDTEEILGGIEGVMHLAAAGGQDLAETSDIVTDALTAMGYAASDANHFADLLATTAANSNTNVAKMGKTFQYAAPLVGTMGYSMEDAALAIGLMANSGIKAEKAGTALRSILTNMVAPTEKQAKVLDALGISLRDEAGNMYSFRDVIHQFRDAFSGLNEVEKANAATVIAGKRAISGFLAIVDDSVSTDKTFEELANQIDNCTGASERMADTMLDNVQGQTTILKSQIEGYMIEVFEHASGSIREAIEIIKKALAEIDWKKVGETVGKAMKKAVEGLVWLIQNRTKVINTIKEIGKLLLTAFATVKITQFGAAILLAYEKLRTYITGLKAAAAMTSKMSVATSLLTKIVSPQGLMVAGIATVATLLYKYWKMGKGTTESIIEMTDAQKKAIDSATEMRNKLDDLNATQEESNEASLAETNYLRSLAEEYNSLVDSNGNVIGKYADRANFILHEMSEATGIEIEQIHSIIDANGKLGESFDSVITKMQLKALIEAGEETFKEYLLLKDEVTKGYAEADSEYNKASAKLSQMQHRQSAAKYNSRWIGYRGVDTGENSDLLEYNNQIKRQTEYMDQLNQAVREQSELTGQLNGAKHSLENQLTELNQKNENYIRLVDAESGSIEDQKQAVLTYTNGLKTAAQYNTNVLAQQLDEYKRQLDSMEQMYASGSKAITKQQIDDQKELVAIAEREVEKAKGLWVDAGVQQADNYAASYMREAKAKAKQTAKTVTDTNIDALSEYDQEWYDEAGDEADAFADGWEDEMDNGGAAIGTYTNSKISTGLVNSKYVIESATKNIISDAIESGKLAALDAKLIGEFFARGLANGIEDNQDAVIARVHNLANYSLAEMRAKYGIESPSKVTYEIGKYFTQGLINGIASQSKNLMKGVDTLAAESVKQLLSYTNHNFDEAASNATNYFTENLAAKVKYITEKITYQNEQLLNDYTTTISKLQEKLSAESDENKKKQIQKEIDAQQKSQKAYQTSSQKMLSEFQTALSDYQNETKTLISNTFKGITDEYEKQWNALEDKQNSMITKLTSTGDLFEVSGAGVMTINDITEQTKKIKDYASKLKKIRGKVSSELFEQISTYDVKEGTAFINQLLAMSNKELKAYDKAYVEKQTVSQTLAEKLYKSDFKKVEDAYKKEVDGILVSFEALGADSMKGFVDGFTKNTDYMEESVKTFVKGMVDTFKKELDIHSPSKVMAKLGNFSGTGFVEGLKNTVRDVKDVTKGFVNSMTNPLSNLNVKGLNILGNNGAAVGTTNVTNTYNLVQNNNSPKALSALDTYRARRKQIAMIQAATQ